MAEPSTSISIGVEFVNFDPIDLTNSLQHQLGDPITTGDGVILVGIGVDQHDFQFTSVRAVDQARGVNHADPVTERQPRPRQDKSGPAERDCDRNASWDQCSATARWENSVLSGIEVNARITGMGIRREC